MKEEFNLSDKECEVEDGGIFYCYLRENVKEFIKKEEYLITEIEAGLISFEEFWIKRKALAGSKLIEGAGI